MLPLTAQLTESTQSWMNDEWHLNKYDILEMRHSFPGGKFSIDAVMYDVRHFTDALSISPATLHTVLSLTHHGVNSGKILVL